MEVMGGFHMNRDDIASQLSKRANIGLGIGYHEMCIHRAINPSKRTNNRWSKGQIRNEMPIHHIQMDPVGPRIDNAGDLFT